MTPRLCALLAAVLLAALPAHAVEPSKQADIEHLLDITGAMALAQQMSAASVAELTRMLRHARPDIPERVLRVVATEVDAVVAENVADLRTRIVPLYDEYFSADEIRELIAFYSSGVGRRTVEVMPQLMGRSMEAGKQWGESLGPLIEARVTERLQREGYPVR